MRLNDFVHGGIFLGSILNLSNASGQVEIYNSEDPAHQPTTPAEALAAWNLPPGFQVTLFAAEPDVRQPIAMTTDSQGRLWVAENYTYAENELRFDKTLRDRIIILTDRDQDGRFDERKVFWDGAQLLTSVELGFGGVWALCPPHLLFIPDRDGDDRPDGEPEVVLTGWNDDWVRHNIANGLKWGPDGWLYGRHGILAPSKVGTPETPPDERIEFTCAIWRYHPLEKRLEVVAQGTTNPWGMDWNSIGEPFFINTVIGHLWHSIPGAHFERMYGEDMNPHVYDLIGQHADHYHWDRSETWSDVRKLGVTDTSSLAGGGHAHSGLMIYQGMNWPSQYRDKVFAINLHGRRLNQDILDRQGSGYVGRHDEDQFFSDDPWFRAVELIQGPDGGVFVADWSDTGECHEHDGVHRSSGRIFKITYQDGALPKLKNARTLSDKELEDWIHSANEWQSRQARQVLHERAANGARSPAAITAFQRSLSDRRQTIEIRLRSLWALNLMNEAGIELLVKLTHDPDEIMRGWAVKLLGDRVAMGPSTVQASTDLDPIRTALMELSRRESTAWVRLSLASVAQRLPVSDRYSVLAPLVAHPEDAEDHNLPLMLWYAIEPVAAKDPGAAARLAGASEIPLLRRFIAQRLGEELDKNPEAVSDLLRVAAQSGSARFGKDVLEGLAEATSGWRLAEKPEAWDDFKRNVAARDDEEQARWVRELDLLFGDPAALKEIMAVALDSSATVPSRAAALETLIHHEAPELKRVAEQALHVDALAGLAARGLAQTGDAESADLLINRLAKLQPKERNEVLEALVSRPMFAERLLARTGPDPDDVPPSMISAYHARQLAALKAPDIARLLEEVWGTVRKTDEEVEQTIADYGEMLDADYLKRANLAAGRALYNQACGACHKLNGEGGEIGPDLTGAGRDNLQYLLHNILAPSDVIPADYTMSILTLKDERVLNGVVKRRTNKTIDILTMTGQMTVNAEDVESIQPSKLSLMPEGLLQGMRDAQVRDLIAYLMKK